MPTGLLIQICRALQQFLELWIFQFFRFQLLRFFELKQQFFKL